MNENTVTKEKMDAMKDLAQVNLKVSEARNLLFKLQEDETKYLEMREKKVMDRINTTLEESRLVLDETKNNWSEIKSIHTTASDLIDSISNIYEQLKETVDTFVSKNEQWERDIGKQQDDLAEIRKEIQTEKVIIENDKKSIKRQNKLIEEAKILIESRQQQIKSALQVLNKKND